MKLETEEIHEKKQALLITKTHSSLAASLKKTLERFDFEVFATARFPKHIGQFETVIVIDDLPSIRRLLSSPPKHTSVLGVLVANKHELGRFGSLVKEKNVSQVKFVNIGGTTENQETVEKILWFLFSSSREHVLDLEKGIKQKPALKILKAVPLGKRLNLTKKRTVFAAVVILLIVEFFFIVPLTISSFFLYNGVVSLARADINATTRYTRRATPFLSLAESSYTLARPILSFFFLAAATDTIIDLHTETFALLETGTETSDNARLLLSLLLVGQKTPHEKQQVTSRLSLLKKQVTALSNTTSTLSHKLTYNIGKAREARETLERANALLDQLTTLLDHADTLLGGEGDIRYLILFQNNMELRPGGGFIGSFGTLTLSDYTLEELKVEDVYTADGQLKGHIDPPKAIRVYLDQPHWYLRDSNFSPDFKTNTQQAEFFLARELGIAPFDAAIGVTTTAITYILDAFDELYLPDYGETINSNNFYIKTQTRTEQDFFPGSIQKKSFLSAIVKALIANLEEAPPQKIGGAVKRALSEKHIVLFVKDEKIQRDLEKLGFGGRLVVPTCATNTHPCVVDSIFPIDANLGVNKANFFVSRVIRQTVTVGHDGTFENSLTVEFKNDSGREVFPGGPYQNYFQLYLPRGARVKSLIHDKTPVTTYEESTDGHFRIIAYFLTVPPQESSRITVTYTLSDVLAPGRNTYQLIIQKQIGSFNNDISFTMELPDNISVVEQNFTALAKDKSLVYNTSLSSDKILLVELDYDKKNTR